MRYVVSGRVHGEDGFTPLVKAEDYLIKQMVDLDPCGVYESDWDVVFYHFLFVCL